MAHYILTPELYVTSYEDSLHFYTNVLNFNILYAREKEKFVMLEREGVEIMFEQVGISRNWITDTLEKPFGRGVNFQIEVSDINKLYQSVKKSGNPLFLDIEEKWYETDLGKTGNKQFIVKDPDGYLLRFFQDLGLKNE